MTDFLDPQYIDPNVQNDDEFINRTLESLKEWGSNEAEWSEAFGQAQEREGEQQSSESSGGETLDENGNEGDEEGQEEGLESSGTSGPGTEEGEQEDEGSQGPESSEGSVTLPNGVQVTLADLQRYYEFEQYLNAHPEVARGVVEAARQGPPSPGGPAPTPFATQPPAQPAQSPIPELPEHLRDDPAAEYFHSQLVAQRQALEALAQHQQQVIQIETQRQAQQAQEAIRARYNLDDTQLASLVQATVDLNVVPGFISRNPSNPVAGFEAALDYTYRATPAFHDHEIARQVEARLSESKQEAERKAKLGKLTSGSGSSSAPTQQQSRKPKTEEEERDAMIEDIIRETGLQRTLS